MGETLITGSHGFLGSRLYDHLVSMEKEVIRGERNGYLPKDVDLVVACQSFGNMYNQTDPEEIWFANVTALENLLGESARYNKLIYCSSTSVLLKQQTDYSLAKAKGERLCELNPKAIAIRPSSITGVGEQKEHLIPKLIDSCLNGTEIPFVGEPTHDFINVMDVISAIGLLNLINKSTTNAFNVSSGITTSNEEVLRLVEEITGNKANIKRVGALRSYDTKDWKVDNSDMRELGWTPQILLEDSIKQMVEAYDK